MAFASRHDIENFIDNLNLIDDVLFRKVAKDPAACEEMLQVILNDDALTVTEVVPQRTLSSLVGRGVIVDALCTLGNGSSVAVEVQKHDIDDHFRRTRYVRASVDTFLAEKGIEFKDIPTVTVVFASGFDPFEAGHAVYHVRKYVEETMQPVNDGATDVYVNAAVDDGSKASRLMAYMVRSEKKNGEFPKLAKRVTYFKESKEGRVHMGDLMEAYLLEYREELRAEAIAEGRAEADARSTARIMKAMDISAQAAMEVVGVPEDEQEAVLALVEKGAA